MSLFEHEARQFKFDVLREVSKRAFNGKINEDTCDEIADLLIPGKKADYRCCIYKEKEIIRQRTRMALGKSPTPVENDNKAQIVRVDVYKRQVTCCQPVCFFASSKDEVEGIVGFGLLLAASLVSCHNSRTEPMVISN